MKKSWTGLSFLYSRTYFLSVAKSNVTNTAGMVITFALSFGENLRSAPDLSKTFPLMLQCKLIYTHDRLRLCQITIFFIQTGHS